MYIFSFCPDFFYQPFSKSAHKIVLSSTPFLNLSTFSSCNTFHHTITVLAHQQLKGFSVPKLPLNFTLSLPKKTNNIILPFITTVHTYIPIPTILTTHTFLIMITMIAVNFTAFHPFFLLYQHFFSFPPEKIVLHHPTVFQEYSTPTAATSLNYFFVLISKKNCVNCCCYSVPCWFLGDLLRVCFFSWA